MYVASKKQMQKIDEILLETYTIEELVDKASDCLLEEVNQYDSYLIVCGAGNNGADGYSLAIKLKELGKQVTVVASSTDKMSQACRYYYEKCNSIRDADEVCLFDYDVVIDALFGFGLHSNPEGIYASLIEWMNEHHHIISIDVPSGLNCDTGEVYKNCIHAKKTISFFASKLGFNSENAKKVIGEVIIKRLDVIDLSDKIYLPTYVDSIHIKQRRHDGHKYHYGKSFLICGSEKYHGAALLSTKASVYTGCGLTCLYSNTDVLNEVSIYVPEAIHTNNIEDMLNYSSILIGCGLENNEELLVKILKETNQPLVIDASSLNDLSKHLDLLNQERPIVLTPHLGEFKRFCPTMDDPTISATQFAKKYHVILVLKGPNTLITNGTISVRNSTGNGGMAIGGSGDVLAGMIVSLLAQGYDAFDACKNAVYLHGLIGDEIYKEEYSVIPSKIIDLIPTYMKKMSS